ncbi:hypothetical protein RUM44_004218 [Polyplax serrata]|uniref:Sugar phosphate transporter domain-containing protein n=1 Tax=Polyplax serrata TaxID=468196 RepID=A0ABR1B276_POLSC
MVCSQVGSKSTCQAFSTDEIMEMNGKAFKKNLPQKYLTIVSVVAAYWFISISVVFINKTLFSSKVIDLKAPIFITWTQCFVSVLICLLWKKLSKVFPKTVRFPKSDPFTFKTVSTFLPVSFLFVLTIGFGNLSLSFVNVSFYFISRCLTTVFNICLSYFLLNQLTSKKALLCCLIIIFGFFLGVDQENVVGSFSLLGTIFGVLSSLSLSLYSIFTKKVLQDIDNQIILLSYYNNLYSSILYMPLIFLNGEYETIAKFNFHDPFFWVLIVIGGTFGFLIGFVTALQIQVTSPLTHNISGTAKACAQTVVATYWYNEVKSLLWWLSNFVVLLGSAAYARVKQLEMTQKR